MQYKIIFVKYLRKSQRWCGIINQIDLKKIKEKRKKEKISTTEMAKKLGLKYPSAYSRRENGIYSFKANEIITVSKILKIPIEKILV